MRKIFLGNTGNHLEFMGIVCSKIPRLEQRQDSTVEQLQDLCIIGTRLGMYGAVDVIEKLLNNINNIF